MMMYNQPPKVIYVKVLKPKKQKINPFKKIKAFFKYLIAKKKAKKESKKEEEECYGYDCYENDGGYDSYGSGW